jgi:hypothetical protein
VRPRHDDGCNLLNVLLRWLRLALLGRRDLAALALALEGGGLVDEDAVDLEEHGNALVGFRWRDRRHRRRRHSLDRCLRLRRLALDLRGEVEVHGLLLAVRRRQGGGRLLRLRRGIRLALAAQGRRGRLAVLGELLMGGRRQRLRVRRARIRVVLLLLLLLLLQLRCSTNVSTLIRHRANTTISRCGQGRRVRAVRAGATTTATQGHSRQARTGGRGDSSGDRMSWRVGWGIGHRVLTYLVLGEAGSATCQLQAASWRHSACC